MFHMHFILIGWRSLDTIFLASDCDLSHEIKCGIFYLSIFGKISDFAVFWIFFFDWGCSICMTKSICLLYYSSSKMWWQKSFPESWKVNIFLLVVVFIWYHNNSFYLLFQTKFQIYIYIYIYRIYRKNIQDSKMTSHIDSYV
jgi:hypothetical protein